jgi:hypothetical protein
MKEDFEKETTRKRRERFLTILDIKRSKNVHGPLWSRPKYYSQISHTPKFSIFYKSGYNLPNTCVGKGFYIIRISELGVPESEADSTSELKASLDVTVLRRFLHKYLPV